MFTYLIFKSLTTSISECDCWFNVYCVYSSCNSYFECAIKYKPLKKVQKKLRNEVFGFPREIINFIRVHFPPLRMFRFCVVRIQPLGTLKSRGPRSYKPRWRSGAPLNGLREVFYSLRPPLRTLTRMQLRLFYSCFLRAQWPTPEKALSRTQLETAYFPCALSATVSVMRTVVMRSPLFFNEFINVTITTMCTSCVTGGSGRLAGTAGDLQPRDIFFWGSRVHMVTSGHLYG